MRLPLLFCMFVCPVAQLHAQRYFVEAHGSYQFPIGGRTGAQSFEGLNADTTRYYEYDRVNLNWGRGTGCGLGLGMEVADHLQVVLRGTFFPGSTTTWSITGRGGETEWTLKMRFIQLEPALRMVRGNSKLSWHFVVGPSFILAPRSELYYSGYSAFDGSTSEQAFGTSGGIGYGGAVGAGVSYAPFRSWGFFAELNCTGQSWSPRRGNVFHNVYNGVDELENLSVSSREYEYVDSYNTNDNNDPNSPTKALRFNYPMSTWGFRAGVRFTFGRRSVPPVEAPVTE